LLRIRRVWTRCWQLVHSYLRMAGSAKSLLLARKARLIPHGAGRPRCGAQAQARIAFVLSTLIFVIQRSGAEAQSHEGDLRGPEGQLFHGCAGVCRLFATAKSHAIPDPWHARPLPFPTSSSRSLSRRLAERSLFKVLWSAKTGHPGASLSGRNAVLRRYDLPSAADFHPDIGQAVMILVGLSV
jgi:hypothetical protein